MEHCTVRTGWAVAGPGPVREKEVMELGSTNTRMAEQSQVFKDK